MPQHRVRERFDIFDGDMQPASQQCTDLAAKNQHLTGPRARSPLDELFDEIEGLFLMGPTESDQVKNGIKHMVRHGDTPDELLALDYGLA